MHLDDSQLSFKVSNSSVSCASAYAMTVIRYVFALMAIMRASRCTAKPHALAPTFRWRKT